MDMRSIFRVCSQFNRIVAQNSNLKNLLVLPHFYQQYTTGSVVLSKQNRAAEKTDGQIHSLFHSTSWWETDCAFVTPLDPAITDVATVVHYKLLSKPSTYFCFSATEYTPGEKWTDDENRPYGSSYMMISYFSDGDIWSYGDHAKYKGTNMPLAKFQEGDILSIQWGYLTIRHEKTEVICPCPEWQHAIHCLKPSSPFLLLRDENNDSKETEHKDTINSKPGSTIPYVIYFKNWKMVHNPFIFPHIVDKPIYPAVNFKANEKVEVVGPIREFDPVPVNPYWFPPPLDMPNEDSAAALWRLYGTQQWNSIVGPAPPLPLIPPAQPAQQQPQQQPKPKIKGIVAAMKKLFSKK